MDVMEGVFKRQMGLKPKAKRCFIFFWPCIFV